MSIEGALKDQTSLQRRWNRCSTTRRKVSLSMSKWAVYHIGVYRSFPGDMAKTTMQLSEGEGGWGGSAGHGFISVGALAKWAIARVYIFAVLARAPVGQRWTGFARLTEVGKPAWSPS